MVVEGVLISVAIGAITGGAGAVAGAGAVVARVAAQAPRFAAILNALRAAAATSASALRTSRSLLTSARGRLAKFVNVTKARFGCARRGGHDRPVEPPFGSAEEARTLPEPRPRAARRPSPTASWRLDSIRIRGCGAARRSRTRQLPTRPSGSSCKTAVARIDHWLRHGEGKLEIDGEAARVVGRVLESVRRGDHGVEPPPSQFWSVIHRCRTGGAF